MKQYKLRNGKITISYGEKLMDECGYEKETNKNSICYIKIIETNIEKGFLKKESIDFDLEKNTYTAWFETWCFDNLENMDIILITPQLHQAISQVLKEISDERD